MCTSLEVDTLKNTCKLYNRRTPKKCLCTRLDFLTVQYMQILFGNFIFCNNQGLFWNRGTFLSWPRKDAMHPEYQTCIFIVLSESEVSAYSLIALNKSHNYQNYTMKGIFLCLHIYNNFDGRFFITKRSIMNTCVPAQQKFMFRNVFIKVESCDMTFVVGNLKLCSSLVVLWEYVRYQTNKNIITYSCIQMISLNVLKYCH